MQLRLEKYGRFFVFENRVCIFSFHYRLVEGDMHYFHDEVSFLQLFVAIEE